MTQLKYLISKFWLESSLNELRTWFDLDDLTWRDQFTQSLVFTLYDISCDKILELQRYLNENLSKDFIQVSCFQIIIFILFIKKLKEELCFCMNYQDLNIITVKNQYSLSLILEMLNHLS